MSGIAWQIPMMVKPFEMPSPLEAAQKAQTDWRERVEAARQRAAADLGGRVQGRGSRAVRQAREVVVQGRVAQLLLLLAQLAQHDLGGHLAGDLAGGGARLGYAGSKSVGLSQKTLVRQSASAAA